MKVEGISASFNIRVGNYGGLPLDAPDWWGNWPWKDLHSEGHQHSESKPKGKFITAFMPSLYLNHLLEFPRGP